MRPIKSRTIFEIVGTTIATKMQTRASRAAAASTRTRPAAAAVVTPSPKKQRSNTSCVSSVARGAARSLCSLQKLEGRSSLHLLSEETTDDTDDIRETMRKLVHSHISSDTSITAAPNETKTETLGGWCLIDGLTHCASAADGKLAPLIEQHGPPPFYLDHIKDNNTHNSSFGDDVSTSTAPHDGYQSFRSLCRIVAGQQLAGSAAKTIWRRLLAVVGSAEDDTSNLTPDAILSIVDSNGIGEEVDGDAMENNLRSPAGLSRSKCRCIVEIARHYKQGKLSDELLLGGCHNGGNGKRDAAATNSDEDIRSRLLSIKGLGPWSVDMFLLFHCHRPDVMPTGDLAFRNGTANLFGVRGSAKGGALCMKKDAKTMKDLHEPFAPYRSISSYYMYKCTGMKG